MKKIHYLFDGAPPPDMTGRGFLGDTHGHNAVHGNMGHMAHSLSADSTGLEDGVVTDIKSLLREAAIVVRCYADREYADIELANQLEAAAESMHTTGTGVDSDQDTVQFTAYLEDLLEQERDKLAAAEEELTRFRNGYKVRVLREALDTIAESDPDESSGSLRDIANRALAITAPERCEI